MKVLLGVVSLLVSTGLLLTGHGMQLTLLPLSAAEAGMSATLIGITASSYFLGFVVGCLFNPRLVARVGHIRAFAVFTAVMISAVLSLDLFGHWGAWIVLRFLTGAAICGLYTVIESWLNSQVEPQSRGRLLAIYTVITLTAMTAGQFLINVGPVSSAVPFTVAALCMALAILPVSMTRRMAPEPVEPTSTGFRLLFQRSRSAFAGALLSGLVTGSFWSLGAVFASHYSETQMDITLFMSIAIGGGAILQYPIGWLSDRIDRRKVLLMLAVGALMASIAVALLADTQLFLAAVFLFGACAMPIYAMSLATAADVSDGSEFVTLGTSALLLNALGAALAPLLLGQLMSLWDATALFWSFAAISAPFAIYLALQLRTPRAVSVDDQTPFEAAAADAAPAAFEMDPRTQENNGEPAADTQS